MKECRDCRQTLPLDRFIAITRPSGKRATLSYCKPCHSRRTGETHKRQRALARASRVTSIPVRASRTRRFKMRELIFDAYGRECACCGESEREFLAVDHIFGGGRAHRLEIGGGKCGGNRFYQWLVNNKFPTGFRILCHNCNQARGHYGACPHERAAYDVPYAVRMEA